LICGVLEKHLLTYLLTYLLSYPVGEDSVRGRGLGHFGFTTHVNAPEQRRENISHALYTDEKFQQKVRPRTELVKTTSSLLDKKISTRHFRSSVLCSENVAMKVSSIESKIEY